MSTGVSSELIIADITFSNLAAVNQGHGGQQLAILFGV